MRAFLEEGRVVMIIVVHVDDIFAVGGREKCDQFGRDLNEMVSMKNLEVALILRVFLRERF